MKLTAPKILVVDEFIGTADQFDKIVSMTTYCDYCNSHPEDTFNNNILVTYASCFGSTEGVAKAVGRTLSGK